MNSNSKIIFAKIGFSMLRSPIHYVLLFLWVFTILAPATITLLNKENKSLVTINLNEEEKQEQGKKDIDENLIVEKKGADFSLLAYLQNRLSSDFYMFGKSEHVCEIILPPPEPLA